MRIASWVFAAALVFFSMALNFEWTNQGKMSHRMASIMKNTPKTMAMKTPNGVYACPVSIITFFLFACANY